MAGSFSPTSFSSVSFSTGTAVVEPPSTVATLPLAQILYGPWRPLSAGIEAEIREKKRRRRKRREEEAVLALVLSDLI